jgi:hypothetical protein
MMRSEVMKGLHHAWIELLDATKDRVQSGRRGTIVKVVDL